MRDGTKALTEAQKTHLMALLRQRQTAEAMLEQFVDYLRAEHNAPAAEWQISTDGFVRTGQVGEHD